ncbi:MAG: nucleotidyltransferase domain-containing protein [Anaerolineae bacterium]|jgi:predicted nucleotidyltransferase
MKRISRAPFESELETIRKGLKQYGAQKAILFGSYARGDYHAGSDVDLIIIKETDLPFLERSAEVWRECRSSLTIEPLVYTPAEFARMRRENNPFVEQALREGVAIYEQERE